MNKTRKRSTKSDSVFPKKEGVDYSLLRMTPEGEYSITKRDDGQKLLQKMKSLLKTTRRKTITDLTGNVGGDTILFGLNFGKVHSIEMNKENFDVLRHNVGVYDLPNVELHHGDSTKLFNWYTDVLYIDPPWGGPGYKDSKELDLFLGDVRVDLFLEKVLQRETSPKWVFMKLPRNYNFARLKDLLEKELIHKLHKFTIRGFSIVGMEV